MPLTALSYVKRGYNNRVYFAECADGSEYVIRIGGRFWDYRKISEQEWCAGFEWLFARAIDPFDETEQQKLSDMTEGQKELLEYFLWILKTKHGILQYGIGYQEFKVALYYLQTIIASWWLRDPAREEWTERQLLSMKTATDSLDKALRYFGC
ncbi:hypothetical protein BX616_006424 [Lobosporangium transversale]|nr:hypothetical protein BX616_006424 [Lobosporangium transversale]